MRQEATETTYDEKENFVTLDNVPSDSQIGADEMNQLKSVTDDHANLLNTLPVIDKYICSDESTPLTVGMVYSDIAADDITATSMTVNVSNLVVDTNLEVTVQLGVSLFAVTIMVGTKFTSVPLPSVALTLGTDIQVTVTGVGIITPPAGLKLKVIGLFTVAPAA